MAIFITVVGSVIFPVVTIVAMLLIKQKVKSKRREQAALLREKQQTIETMQEVINVKSDIIKLLK